MDLIGKLVLIDGIVARPELNGQLGLVRSYHQDKGRCEVRLVSANVDSNKSLALKPERLLDWSSQPITDVEDDASMAKMIEEASPEELLGYWRDNRFILRKGATALKDNDVVTACIMRNLNLPIGTTGQDLMNGGIIEMSVQAIDAHLENRGMLWFLVNCLGMTLLGGKENDLRNIRFTINSRMKDRAIEAGAVDRIRSVLSEHLTGDVQCVALSLIYALATGGNFPETKARKEACSTLTLDLIAAMKLAPHKSAVQHYAIQALGSICDGGAPSETLDLLVAQEGHAATLEAMRRHGHIVGEKGMCVHKIETEDGMADVTMHVPGSILLAGCQLLFLLIVTNESGKDDRVEALNNAGSLSVIASAILANPVFSPDEGVPATDLASAPFLVPFIGTLCGDRPLNQVMPQEEDRLLLIGDAAREGDQDLETIMSKTLNPMELSGLLGVSYKTFFIKQQMMAAKIGK